MTIINNEDWLNVLENTDYIPIENEEFNPNYNTVYAGVDNAEQCTVSGGT